MQTLRDSITILRPSTCFDCPYSYDDPEEGTMCDHDARYVLLKTKGLINRRYRQRINTPEEALQYHYPCKFIKKN